MNHIDDRAAKKDSTDVEPVFYGARWAVILGAALLIALTLLTAARRLGQPAASAEQIVQVPVAAVTPKPLPPPEILAPDPGDTP